MSMQIEHIIRDWLVDHPEFIENGLQVINKEHYISDDIGSNGFIDILCKDVYNNFVIVEIKRSDSTARQTFTEVLKYAELIQNKYNARDGEIRIIIISTHWNEIIRAFSHIYFNTNFTVHGLQISINEQTKIPEAIEPVMPISKRTFSRKFMSSQILFLFHSVDKRLQAHSILNEKLKRANVPDFVTVDLNAPNDKPIIYPYALSVAFQKHSKNELLHIISLLKGEYNLDMDEDEFYTEEEYLNYLEQVFIVSLEMQGYIDSLEVGCAEKFDSIINVQNWQITALNKYGIFNTDPRYSNELLLKELKGHDGNSPNKFVGFSESTQKERIIEIRSECQYSLSHTPQWAEFIDFTLKELEKSTERFKIILDIYNPYSLINALYFTIIKGNPDYLPCFIFLLYFPDQNKHIFYHGNVLSTNSKPKLKIFTSTDFQEVSDEFFHLWVNPINDKDAISVGLKYVIQKTVLIDDFETSKNYVSLIDKNIKIDENQYSSIEEYFIRNQDSIGMMIKNYSDHSLLI